MVQHNRRRRRSPCNSRNIHTWKVESVAPRSGTRTQIGVLNFLTVLFQFSSSIYFWVVIAYIIWCQIWILSLRVSPDLNRALDSSVLPDLTSLVSGLTDFSFKHYFPIFQIFHDFLKFFRIILQNLQNRCRSASLTDSQIFSFQMELNFQKRSEKF